MAEHDDSQKTEEPTQRKLEEAAKKGDFAQSQEFKHWMMLLGAAVAWLVVGAPLSLTLLKTGGGIIAHLDDLPTDGGALLALVREELGQVLLVLSGLMAILVLAGIAANLLQHKLVFTTEKLKFSPEKISPVAGWKRLFSAQRVADFLKSLLKLVVVGAVVLLLVWPEREAIMSSAAMGIAGMLALVRHLALKVLFGVLAAMAVIAAADYLFQRQQHMKKMRMTKQEVKDEYKQMEGDPHVKARIRQLRQERARKRMMANVPKADVVITNPTHYAVALEYEHGRTEVPIVLAKGIDEVALRIRRVAEEHDIPVVENPPLARALYASVEIDEEIPPEHYQAVAQVIGTILRLAGRRSWRTRPPAGR